MSQSTLEQDRIEAGLKDTRSRMDQRLNELQDKLTPSQMVGDMMDYVRGNGGGELARNLITSVQANPLPAVVAGIGLAWLMASNFRPQPAAQVSGYRNNDPAGDFESRVREAESRVYRTDHDSDTSYSEKLDTARGKVLGVARQAQDTAASYAERIKAALAAGSQSFTERSHDLRDGASNVAGRLNDSVSNAAGSLNDSVSSAAGRIKETFQNAGGQMAQGAKAAQQGGGHLLSGIVENPVILGAMGLAFGALLGVLIPSSAQEDAALGGIAGQARDTVKGVAQDLVDRGAELTKQTVDAAKTSAGEHGLTTDKSVQDVAGDLKSGDLVQNVKGVAQDVLQAGEKALRQDKAAPQQDDPGATAASSPETALGSRPMG